MNVSGACDQDEREGSMRAGETCGQEEREGSVGAEGTGGARGDLGRRRRRSSVGTGEACERKGSRRNSRIARGT